MFKGIFTAIITPFRDGMVDEHSLRLLVSRQLENDIDGIVPCGTTGESPTLTHDEFKKVISIVVDEVKGTKPVIAGTGTNSTSVTIEKTKIARLLKADGALVVCPYYNKPTQDGLFQHFKAVADEGKLPVVIYNIPSRTGVGIEPQTIKRCADVQGIVAIKEASGSVSQVIEIKNLCDDKITILSGDDGLALPFYSVGADGLISVASNVVPSSMKEMYHQFKNGDINRAMVINKRLYPLFKTLFIETNPIPVKCALMMLGLCTDEVRLPLTKAGEQTKTQLKQIMKELDLFFSTTRKQWFTP